MSFSRILRVIIGWLLLAIPLSLLLGRLLRLLGEDDEEADKDDKEPSQGKIIQFPQDTKKRRG